MPIRLSDLPFSKQKQVMGILRDADKNAAETILRAEKIAKLKKTVKNIAGVSFGIERSNNHKSMKGWIEFTGKRYYMKSSWERNISRYYDYLKQIGEIEDWYYEPQRFMFDKIKRGTNSYLPDFKIIEKNKKEVWVEVKGYMAQKDRTKLKRFSKYYPDKTLVLIDKEAYNAIKKAVKNIIPEWE